ncbi:hypothetical protein [Trinickia terrae]|uniref:hypothetical protein n=1 Tax=Trinickia terrae TaxID=2571161 RepID=UPI001F0DC640|nr:hypothetical protein [Trinickia terrae]
MGEISLGGPRLTRFMKDVESVTGHMGEIEAMATEEEVANAAAASGELPEDMTTAQANIVEARAHSGIPAAEPVPQEARVDPWSGLLQFGVELASALSASAEGMADAHPWVDRDPATGAQSLKLPLPSAGTARRLADALSAISSALRVK